MRVAYENFCEKHLSVWFKSCIYDYERSDLHDIWSLANCKNFFFSTKADLHLCKVQVLKDIPGWLITIIQILARDNKSEIRVKQEEYHACFDQIKL